MTILHIPHASLVIPDDLRRQFVLGDAELDEDVRRLTDHYTDELFSVSRNDIARLVFPVSRFVCDPERFFDDEQEPMAARGHGVLYALTTQGTPLRRSLSPAERESVLARYYWPHHRKLSDLTRRSLSEHGKALVIDCHSFPSQPLPIDLDQGPDRPDICLGTDPIHTPDWLVEKLQKVCEDRGRSVAINRPYAGTMVPNGFYKEEPRVHSVMIEINRALYLADEPEDCSRGSGFSDTRQLAHDLITAAHDAIGAGVLAE